LPNTCNESKERMCERGQIYNKIIEPLASIPRPVMATLSPIQGDIDLLFLACRMEMSPKE